MNSNSLDQYLNLYDTAAEAIDSHSIAPLNALRHKARRELDGASLPDTRTEGYEQTSIDELMAPDLGVNINRLNLSADVAAAFRCDIPNMSTLLGVVVGDIFHPTETLLRNLPDGVEFGPISQIYRRHPEVVEKYYGAVAPLTHPAVALNTLLAQDAVMLYVRRGIEVSKPLQLVNLFSAAAPMAAFRRLLIVMEEGASAQLLLCDHTQSAAMEFISSQVIEVICHPHSRLDIYDIEKSTPLTRRHSLLFARLDDDTSTVFNATTLSNGTTRNDFNIDIRGSRAETLVTGMAICSGSQHVDNSSTVEHHAPRSRSNQLFKYALDGEARGAFGGSIVVGADAPFTEAFQTNRNIVASAQAKMNTRPTLLIYNDEVKCSHGATTGRIDDNALFYMRTRGIPEAEARTMLMQAFMVDVIDSVRLPSLRDRLRHLVEKRFCQGSASCPTCTINPDYANDCPTA